MAGWIKIERSIVNHWIWQDEKYFRWWIAILLNVNHFEKKFPVNSEVFTCQPGESFRSIEDWSRVFGCSKPTVFKFFQMLENDEMISTKTVGKGNRRKHLLTVVNWVKYQKTETGNFTENFTENKPETLPKVNHNKKEKEKEKEKEEIEEGAPPNYSLILQYFQNGISELKLNIDPESETFKFFNFYSAKDWQIGQNKIVDFRAAVNVWLARTEKKPLTSITETGDYEYLK